ncbi:MAG: SMC-Scp complex subunit ScpB [Clostridia bacterium]|jgi:segregation and condensation protein B|nr:SMC-Scp complex subunit ScpB [Clostridia bacterium]
MKSNIGRDIEAILFISGKKIEEKVILSSLDMKKIELAYEINKLNETYKESNSGIEIIKVGNGYQMVTTPESHENLKKVYEKVNKTKLTQAVLETLAIIAYRQPVTKSEVEDVRGVSCEHSFNKLLKLGIIEEVGRLEKIGRPIIFGTTDEFLRIFGFESVDEIKEFEENLIIEDEVNEEEKV